MRMINEKREDRPTARELLEMCETYSKCTGVELQNKLEEALDKVDTLKQKRKELKREIALVKSSIENIRTELNWRPK